MRLVLTACPFCSCGCGLYLQEDASGLAGVAPSEHHVVSQGRLCARGWATHEAPSWGERLTHPLVRRGNGLEPASWDEALEVAVSALRDAREAGEATGVIGSARATNEESWLVARLARDALRTANLDSSLRATWQPLADGIADVGGPAALRGTLDDVEASDVILLLEGDLARTHPRAALAVLRAVRRGGRLLTLGAVRTQLARLAALHLPVVPGREAEALAGLVAAVRALEGTKGSSPEPADPLRRAALWLAQATRASAILAPMGAEPLDARQAARELATLVAVAGHLGRTGSAILALAARGNLRGSCAVGVLPDRLPGSRGPDDREASQRLGEIWGREPHAADGLDVAAMLERVSALIVVADDPPTALPAGAAARSALGRAHRLIVLDAFRTETAQQAHVVLPIAAFVETDGSVTSAEGRVLRVRAAIAPPGEARPGWRVLTDLLARLGVRAPYRSPDDVLAEIGRGVREYATAASALRSGAGDGLLDVQADGRGRPLEAAAPPTSRRAGGLVLARDGVLDWGSDPYVAFSPTLRREHASQRKLFPQGLVELSARDAERLGIRGGWPVRISSAEGEAVLPVVMREDLEPGVALVPFAFRDSAAGVLGESWMTEVRVARA
jgi:predicted molibdopterin-dependent oxidoreductase YjgC